MSFLIVSSYYSHPYPLPSLISRLEWLEKNEAAAVQQGYSLSVAYHSLMDIAHSIYAVIEEQSSPTFRKTHKEFDPQKHKGNLIRRHLPG